ncbi:MAG: flagellar protein FlgN [Nocardioidaceae bacterium]|nr:flagellar protein FlgN [Nocardioidaceae bacterium]NUS50555.1 flagellar protein FlgN [Nocardioidaceae bacterium]
MSMEDLSSVLWRERDLLELLLFKLEVEQLVLAGGRSHWLPAAAREIEAVLAEIREVELLRSVRVDELAEEIGLDPNPSLSQIAEASPEPWKTLWLDHRESFATVAAQITEMSQSNRVLLTAGYQAAQATLLSLTERAPTYDAAGAVGTLTRTGLVDRSL